MEGACSGAPRFETGLILSLRSFEMLKGWYRFYSLWGFGARARRPACDQRFWHHQRIAVRDCSYNSAGAFLTAMPE
jgi:hypothetical protein